MQTAARRAVRTPEAVAQGSGIVTGVEPVEHPPLAQHKELPQHDFGPLRGINESMLGVLTRTTERSKIQAFRCRDMALSYHRHLFRVMDVPESIEETVPAGHNRAPQLLSPG